MEIEALRGHHSHPVSYRIAEQVGAGTLHVDGTDVSIRVSNSDDGVVGVEPIRLTRDQWSRIVDKDDGLFLEA